MAIDVEGDQVISSTRTSGSVFASTLKAFAAAVLLDTTSKQERERLVRWTLEDVEAAGYSPVTKQAVDTGLTLAELAEISAPEGDNTALNLVLAEIGGPEGLQRALRKVGDGFTQVDDVEPALNDGDPAKHQHAEALAENSCGS